MLRKLVWKLKTRGVNLYSWLLVGGGLVIGGAAGWWLSLAEWERDDLVYRAKWVLAHRDNAGSDGQRPYRHFKNCNEARLAGYGSIEAWEPSYRAELDDDHDGVACEPWTGSGNRFRFRF